MRLRQFYKKFKSDKIRTFSDVGQIRKPNSRFGLQLSKTIWLQIPTSRNLERKCRFFSKNSKYHKIWTLVDFFKIQPQTSLNIRQKLYLGMWKLCGRVFA